MKRHIAVIGTTALAGIAMGIAAAHDRDREEEPFKQTNIHFETNASACDMGIQMSFDTDGVTRGEVEDPYGQSAFRFGAVHGLEATHDITEMFQERVEPPIKDLEQALGCEPSEDAIWLSDLLASWPEGWYEFDGRSGRTEFEGKALLTHKIPAGPEIVSPQDGAIVTPDADLSILWEEVTEPLLPYLGPVEVVGYHVLAVDVTNAELAPGQTKTSFDADVSASETSFLVPKQYLEPNRIYELEILATEKNGNQTITEGGVFCTLPMAAADCVKP